MGELRTRTTGSVVADRRGPTTGYAIQSLQERSTLFIEPGTIVYEGMIVGENARLEDMDVNICREKKLTNVRASSSDDTIRLAPPKKLDLEQSLEFIASDECVEVTPTHIRLRKVTLDAGERARSVKRLKRDRS
jgi:GTP-binding protein